MPGQTSLPLSYGLQANFNGIRLLRPAEVHACPECGHPFDPWSERLVLSGRPRVDFSICIDGFWIVSPRFLRMIEVESFVGAGPRSLSNGFAVLRPTRAVEIDMVAIKAKPFKPCFMCGQYGEILVHGERRLAPDEAPLDPRGFARSAVVFGDKSNKRFDIYVGAEVHAALSRHLLTGWFATPMLTQVVDPASDASC